MKTGNEVLAEFMGWTQHEKVDDWMRVPKGEDIKFKAWKLRKDSLMFDREWDWLMDVVEKIEGLGHDVDMVWHSNMRDGQETRHAICAIQDRPPFKAIAYVEGKPMIKSVYKAVLQFINWYNEQKVKG
jgi:hypothetical protein